MNREKEYYETVDLLLDAFSKATLQHGSCAACAVGNICAKGVGIETLDLKDLNALTEPIKYPHSHWFSAINVNPEYITIEGSEGNKAMDSTPYTRDELLDIERSFENEAYKDQLGRTQLHGLTAVLNQLKKIHEVDQEISDTNQKRLKEVHNELHPENLVEV